MRFVAWGIGPILALAPVHLVASEDDGAFLEALLEKGYLELVQKHPSYGKGTGLASKLLDIKLKQASIKSGKGSADTLGKELEALFAEGEKLVDPKAPTAEAADLLYDYGEYLFERGQFEEAIKRFVAFSQSVNAVLETPPSESARRRLTEKNYDADLFLGRAYLGRTKQISADKKEDKLSAADSALEHLENYVWSLNDYSSYAVKAYSHLCELWDYLGTEGRKEEADEFFKSLLATEQADGAVVPLFKVEVNPDSIKNIFDVALYLVRRAPAPADKLKVAKELVGKLKKLPIDTTPEFYMKHQLGTLLAQFCIDVSQEELPARAGDSLKEDAKNFLRPIPADPKVSAYATEVQRIAGLLGMESANTGAGMASLTLPARKLYGLSQFSKGIRILENLLASTEQGSATRAQVWFYIGQGYYQEKRFLEACYAFERSHDTLPTWSLGADMSAQRAYKLMYNAAKLHSLRRTDVRPSESQLKANRAFIQDIRSRFSSAYPNDKDAIEAMYYMGRDYFFSPWIERNLDLALATLSKVPEGHPQYASSLFYRFKCAFKKFVGAASADPKTRDELFNACIAESEKFLELTSKLDVKSTDRKVIDLLKQSAQTRCEVVQLNLLQDGRAQAAVELLEGDFEKKYGSFLDKEFLDQLPKWQIEGLYKVGSVESLKKAMGIWETWQAKALREFEADRAKDPKAKLNSHVIQSTQNLSNKGIKDWLRRNPGHAETETFQKLNTQLTTWITKNVQVTPLLLLQLMYNDDKASQHQSVVDFAAQYLELANTQWASGSNAAESSKYINDVYRLQLKHLEALNTEEGWAQAAECQGAYFERGRAKNPPQYRPTYLVSKAEALLKAGALCPDKAKAKEKYYGAVVTLSLEIRKKYCTPLNDRWWSTYEMNIDALEGTEEYERAFGILESLRLSVTDTQARRAWLLGRLDRLEKLDGSLAERCAKLREGLAQDKAEFESAVPTPEEPATPTEDPETKDPQ
ncbi:MAG: hypothetical protein AB7F75_04995 [Planctomycetota bacterium]